jgi:hypothetical protein
MELQGHFELSCRPPLGQSWSSHGALTTLQIGAQVPIGPELELACSSIDIPNSRAAPELSLRFLNSQDPPPPLRALAPSISKVCGLCVGSEISMSGVPSASSTWPGDNVSLRSFSGLPLMPRSLAFFLLPRHDYCSILLCLIGCHVPRAEDSGVVEAPKD